MRPGDATEATAALHDPAQGDARPVQPGRYETLKQRADFLSAARARRRNAKAFAVQARFRDDGSPRIRVGFTCSKKVGNAVARNRAKRRLRALAHEVIPTMGLPGFDYVLIGRPEATATHPFDAMREDLRRTLDKLHEA